MIPPTSFVHVESLIVNEALQLVQVPSLIAPNSSEVFLSGFLQEAPVCPSCPSFRVLHDREAIAGGLGCHVPGSVGRCSDRSLGVRLSTKARQGGDTLIRTWWNTHGIRCRTSALCSCLCVVQAGCVTSDRDVYREHWLSRDARRGRPAACPFPGIARQCGGRFSAGSD